MLAALVFLAAYAIPIIWPELGDSWGRPLGIVLAVTWVAFGVDYAVRLWLSEKRWSFVGHHLPDLAMLVLPLLRPLRLLRLVTLLSVLNRAGSNELRGRVVTYAVGATSLLILCGGLAITDAERGQPDGTVAGFGDGLWWAVATLTTVGYGDTYPVTLVGRFVAVVLMTAGIALLGVVTATLASWLVEKVSEVNEDDQAATRAQVAELTASVEALRRELQAQRAEQTESPPTTGADDLRT